MRDELKLSFASSDGCNFAWEMHPVRISTAYRVAAGDDVLKRRRVNRIERALTWNNHAARYGQRNSGAAPAPYACRAKSWPQKTWRLPRRRR
jgi:hypothetical protein